MDFIGLFLDKKNSKPLYQQLYRYLAAEIRNGHLAAGEKLPGKRTAASQLGISVNTVDEAYQMLVDEGYVKAKPRSGFVVNKLEQMVPLVGGEEIIKKPIIKSFLQSNSFNQNSSRLNEPHKQLKNHNKSSYYTKQHYSFASGGIDTSLFPRKTWNRLFREVLAEIDSLFEQGEAQGDIELREAIAVYLRGWRGVRCNADEIVVGAGLEVLTGLLARLFAGETVAIENPGYPKVERILQNMGVGVSFVEADDEGIRPDLLQNSGAHMTYLTPSHQFPTGAVMPAGRRSSLLRWAAANSHYIIEDDYDSEFRFDGRPLPSLQGLDNGEHVVYAGTFTRSLAPGLRVAYLVLPTTIQQKWENAYHDYSCTVSRPEQQTLARLITRGHFSRNLNRTRAVYKKRRGLLIEQLQEQLKTSNYKLENIHTGLYFILRLPNKSATHIAQAARERGIRLRALSEYQQTGSFSCQLPVDDALVIGYGGLPDEQIEPAVTALANIIKRF